MVMLFLALFSVTLWLFVSVPSTKCFFLLHSCLNLAVNQMLSLFTGTSGTSSKQPSLQLILVNALRYKNDSQITQQESVRCFSGSPADADSGPGNIVSTSSYGHLLFQTVNRLNNPVSASTQPAIVLFITFTHSQSYLVLTEWSPAPVRDFRILYNNHWPRDTWATRGRLLEGSDEGKYDAFSSTIC